MPAAVKRTTRGRATQLAVDPKGERFMYTNGRTVVIRDLNNPAIASEYVQHVSAATLARWSPSGYYVASADVQGNVRIWDAINDEHILKGEYRVLAGRVNDLAWDAESKRIIVVGDGREKYGHAFLFDSGSSVGDIMGHSKQANACDMRPSGRPFRAVTCSDDNTVCFFHGAPYKFNLTLRDHSRFVNSVRYAPCGDHFVSVGADAKMFLYNGLTAEKECEFSAGHTGSIYAAAWSPDSRRIMTSSADTMVKIWDVETGSAITTVNCAGLDVGALEAQQVGNLWSRNGHLLSLSLSGCINYLDERQRTPTRVVEGHSKAIMAMTVSTDRCTLFTGSFDGRVYAWEDAVESGRCHQVADKEGNSAHKMQVTSLASTEQGGILSVSMDEVAQMLPTKKISEQHKVGFSALSAASSSDGSAVCILGSNEVAIMSGSVEVGRSKLEYNATAISVSGKGDMVAIGGEDGTTRIYSLNDATLTPSRTVSGAHAVTSVSTTPIGDYLAVGDAQGRVMVYNAHDGTLFTDRWVSHRARVLTLSWSPDGRWCASGGLDTHVFVWDMTRPSTSIAIKNAHLEAVTAVAWVISTDGTVQLATAGRDGCVRLWTITE